jgi:hypothetical protein
MPDFNAKADEILANWKPTLVQWLTDSYTERATDPTKEVYLTFQSDVQTPNFLGLSAFLNTGEPFESV